MKYYNDDKLTNTLEYMAEMLLDIKAACKGVRVEDSMYHCYDIDREEAREVIIDTAEKLCRCVCEYAAYTKAYEEALNACGIDIRKCLDQNGFEALSGMIRESLEKTLKERASTMVMWAGLS